MKKSKYSKLIYEEYGYIGKKRKFDYQKELENLIVNYPKSMKQKHIVDNGKIVLVERSEEEIKDLLQRDYETKKRKSIVYRFFKEKEYKSNVDIEYNMYVNDLEFSYDGKSFLKKYGNNIVSFKGEEKTIQSFLFDFMNRKISREDMNKILYEFKAKSTKYKNAGSS